MTAPRADAARPVPADVLEKCARLLGKPWVVYDGRLTDHLFYAAKHGVGPASDGDILLAILNKAAEMGYLCALSFDGDVWQFSLRRRGMKVGHLTSSDVDIEPLEAAILAFSQLEPPHD